MASSGAPSARTSNRPLRRVPRAPRSAMTKPSATSGFPNVPENTSPAELRLEESASLIRTEIKSPAFKVAWLASGCGGGGGASGFGAGGGAAAGVGAGVDAAADRAAMGTREATVERSRKVTAGGFGWNSDARQRAGLGRRRLRSHDAFRCAEGRGLFRWLGLLREGCRVNRHGAGGHHASGRRDRRRDHGRRLRMRERNLHRMIAVAHHETTSDRSHAH